MAQWIRTILVAFGSATLPLVATSCGSSATGAFSNVETQPAGGGMTSTAPESAGASSLPQASGGGTTETFQSSAGAPSGVGGAAAQVTGPAESGGETSTPPSAMGGASSGQGGAAASTTTCAPGCISICQAGICDCDCSMQRGCSSPGWSSVTMPWADFRLSDAQGDGVSLCHPENWYLQEPQAANERIVVGPGRISILAWDRIDHEGALQRVSDVSLGNCGGVDFLEVGGWPAALAQFESEPAMCGACEPVLETGMDTNVFLRVAVGQYVVELTNIFRDPTPEYVQGVRDILLTATFSLPEGPGDTEAEIAELRAATCP